MLLPMFGFFVALVVFGGLGALVAQDSHAARVRCLSSPHVKDNL